MKNFYISEILLLSKNEKAGRKIKFNDGINIIHGGNGTGKSSLIKHIYHAFGANVKLHPKFKKLETIVAVRFSIETQKFLIIRDQNHFGIFDSNNNEIGIYSSVTNELSNKIAELFDFKLNLRTHANTNNPSYLKQALPAFLYLPYYMDQDKSWSKAWNSFENLSQFSRPENELINYHLGINDNEYYELQSENLNIKESIKKIDIENEYTKKISTDIQKKLNISEFNIDIELFSTEIEELLIECNKLKKEEDIIKDKLKELYGIKSNILEQIKVVDKAIIESKKDYNYANEKLEDDIECPTCGAHYDNSFGERFSIAMDEDGGRDLLIQLKKELKSTDLDIENVKSKVLEIKNNTINLEKILKTKKKAIELNELLKHYGKNEIKLIFNDKIKDLHVNLGELSTTEKEIEFKIKEYKKNNKERSDKIKSEYKQILKKFLSALNVLQLKEEDYKSIYTSLDKKETGSAMPRALLAYYFTFFHLMKKYSSSIFCPIIIDSPNQQAQDPENIPMILEFIKANLPSRSQLILGLEEFYGVNFNEANLIKLTDKANLLKEDDYLEISNELSPFLEKVWL